MDSSRTDKFKKWYDRNKQKIILLLGMAVVLILIFGLIIRRSWDHAPLGPLKIKDLQ